MPSRCKHFRFIGCLLSITYSAAEAEIIDLKAAHKKALDKAKKDNTKLKAKLLAASKNKEHEEKESVEESPSKSEPESAVSADEKVQELVLENEKLREELTEMKTKKLGEIR